MKPNRKRTIDTFVPLARIRSPLMQVGLIMAHMKAWADAHYFTYATDEAGKNLPGFEHGNLIINVPASLGYEHLPVRAAEAHVDTVGVPQGKTVNPVVEGNIICTDGTTILGGDNKAGVAAIMEAIEIITESNRPHGPLQLLITVGEERSMYGVREMDYGLVKAKSIICCDGMEGNVLWRGCAAKLKYRFMVHGKRGHGAFPEHGLNALLMACEAVEYARVRGVFGAPYGLIDRGNIETNVWHNLAEVKDVDSGNDFPATNNIVGEAIVAGELRSFNKDAMEEIYRMLLEAFENTTRHRSADGKHHGSFEVETERPYDPFVIPSTHPLVQEVLDHMHASGINGVRDDITQGATHASVHNSHGIPSVVLGCGDRNPHMTDEHVVIDEMVHAADVIARYLTALQ